MPDPNPYETPLDTTCEERAEVAVARRLSTDDDDDPVALRINIPAFGLSAIAWMRLIFDVPLLAYAGGLLIYNGAYLSREMVSAGLLVLIAAGAVTIDLLILWGATAMLASTHLDRARLAASLAFLPTSPLFFLHAPFGIWVLRVLQDDEVKARFHLERTRNANDREDESFQGFRPARANEREVD